MRPASNTKVFLALSETLKTERTLLEILAVMDVIKKVVGGFSNNTISTMFDIEISDVSDIVFSTLGFQGFTADLKFSPIHVFNDSFMDGVPSYTDFKNNLMALDTDVDSYKLLYDVCLRYFVLSEILERNIV